MCLILTCSISNYRYIYCYFPRNQKNYLRLVEPYEEEAQAIESVKLEICNEIVTKRSLLASLTSFSRNDGMIMSSGMKKRKLVRR